MTLYHFFNAKTKSVKKHIDRKTMFVRLEDGGNLGDKRCFQGGDR